MFIVNAAKLLCFENITHTLVAILFSFEAPQENYACHAWHAEYATILSTAIRIL